MFMLFFINFYTMFQLWIISWRKTISPRVFMAFFAMGLFTATSVAFVSQWVCTRFMVPNTVSYTFNPFIEEIAKIVPLVVFILLNKEAFKQLKATDFMLLALATGTGFGMMETYLYLVSGMDMTNRLTFSLVLPQISSYTTTFADILGNYQQIAYSFAGHGILSAAVGLSLGVALTVAIDAKSKKYIFALPTVVLLWVIANHSISNYLDIASKMFYPLQFVLWFDRSGRVIVWFFGALLLGTIIREEILHRNNPDKKVDVVQNEAAMRFPKINVMERILDFLLTAFIILLVVLLKYQRYTNYEMLFRNATNVLAVIAVIRVVWLFWKNKGVSCETVQGFSVKVLSYTALGLTVLSVFAYIVPFSRVLFPSGIYSPYEFLYNAFGRYFNDFGGLLPGFIAISAAIAGIFGAYIDLSVVFDNASIVADNWGMAGLGKGLGVISLVINPDATIFSIIGGAILGGGIALAGMSLGLPAIASWIFGSTVGGITIGMIESERAMRKRRTEIPGNSPNAARYEDR